MLAYVAAPESADGIRLEEVAEPVTVRPDQAIVDVRSTALNRGEFTHLRKRAPGEVLGWDFAGVVSQAASDGSGQPIDTPVFGWSSGSWAQRVLVEPDQMEPIVEGMTMATGAAIGVAGVTALYALRHGGSLLGRHVVVTGAAGGVGRMAVQLAVLAGAHVTAVVGESQERSAAVESLQLVGVEIVHELAPLGERAHLILESVGGDSLSAAFRRVARRGCIVTYGRSSGQPGEVPPHWFYRDARLVGLQYSEDAARDRARPSALAILGSLAAARRLDPGIGVEYEWDLLPVAARQLLARSIAGRAVLHVS
jgi:NADPH2:quinone reductase